MSTNGVFSEEELKVFEDNEKIRRRVISKLSESELDKDGDDTDKLTILLKATDSSDAMALKRKNLMIKDEGNKINSDTNDLVTNILRGISSSSKSPVNRSTDLPEELIPKDIVDGEMDIGKNPVDPSKFLDIDGGE